MIDFVNLSGAMALRLLAFGGKLICKVGSAASSGYDVLSPHSDVVGCLPSVREGVDVNVVM